MHTQPVPNPSTTRSNGISQRLNWLRAGVLGANDGIVSVAALVVGVAGATSNTAILLVSGIAALTSGAISMALGEYVSVSAQRDSEKHLILREKTELKLDPEQKFHQLSQIYEAKGLTPETAQQVAKELTAHDALAAHLEADLGINEQDIVNPWHAVLASAIAFTLGGILPLSAILIDEALRVPVTFIALIITLAITGYIAAWIGGSPKLIAILRLIFGGLLALTVTYTIGSLLGLSGIL